MHWMLSVNRLYKSDKQYIGFLLMSALMIFLLPLRWLVATLIAALIHELGHYAAVRMFGGSVHCLRLSTSGAIMESSGINQYAAIICLLAGPLAGLLPLLAFRYIPVIALCGLIQSIYNILPIYPLDGGKILRYIILMSGGTDLRFRFVEKIIISALFVMCVYIRVRFGISLFCFLAGFLFLKTPCKPKQDWI